MHFDLESMRLELWHNILLQTNADKALTNESLSNDLLELCRLEMYWAYPGKEIMQQLQHYIASNDVASFNLLSKNVTASLLSKSYLTQAFSPFATALQKLSKPQIDTLISDTTSDVTSKKPYFEVLIVHPNPVEYENLYRSALQNYITFQDSCLYDIVFVDNYQDAIIAILSNSNIKHCVYLAGFSAISSQQDWVIDEFKPLLSSQFVSNTNDYYLAPDSAKNDIAIKLKLELATLRPELQHYCISEILASEEQKATFDNIIYIHDTNFYANLHHHILSGIENHFATPFFDALRTYAKQPKVSFHALPISQSKSLQQSSWLQDVGSFYGNNIFSAETSSTLGGMDSLMDPKGSISQAQNKAAVAFGSLQTYFITNGTTAANKIVMQANLSPNSIVLVSSDCHKSIPYSVLLSGATPIFLETYPLDQYDLYGCVTLQRIKAVLLDLKKQNKLHKVKQITLTNATFDGLIYDVRRYVLDILAIKPDIIFHWDEAWFAFGCCNSVYNQKNAMSVANMLAQMQTDTSYIEFYKQWSNATDFDDDAYLINHNLYPDPAKFRIRMYATQSTHKTLSAFRQASMLHIYDVDFKQNNFYEAYRTHTSTSANYQIIASLDFARRQISLEGYDLIKKALQLSWQLQQAISTDTKLKKYFAVLTTKELVDDKFNANQTTNTATKNTTNKLFYPQLLSKYKHKLFIVDPTKITLDISKTGIDGPNFRQLLMTQYDIQVNKTSRNTILIIISIGTDNNDIKYLLETLAHIASKLDLAQANITEPSNNSSSDSSLVILPKSRSYHPKFISVASNKKLDFAAVNIRVAYYAGLEDENSCFVQLTNELMQSVMAEQQIVSASFVTPYPPGFPIIVPGQLITYDILIYLQNIQISEIHGYHADKGLKIFTDSFLST